MRLWHEKLIPYLDRQRLLGQHRECAALRGKGWGKKHATVDYAFTHKPVDLIVYHYLVMNEMEQRGYHPDPIWRQTNWRGNIIGETEEIEWNCGPALVDYLMTVEATGATIYPEHDEAYLTECIALLKEKNAPIDWEKVEQDGLLRCGVGQKEI